MRLLVLCTGHKVASNLPQGCVPQNYATLWFAYFLPLHDLVVLHSALSLNNGIVTLIGVIFYVSKVDTLSDVLVITQWYSTRDWETSMVLGQI